MPDLFRVTVVAFVPAPRAERTRGILGWVDLRVPGLHLDSVAVRRTRDGRLVLSFPERRGRAVVRPEDNDARRAIEAQVIAALRQQGHVP